MYSEVAISACNVVSSGWAFEVKEWMPSKCESSVSNISLVGSATPKMSSFSSVVTYKVSTMVGLSFYFVFVVLSLSFLGLGPQLYFCLFNFFQLLFASFLHILLLLSSSSIAFLLKVLFVFSFLQLWASCVCNLNVSAWLLSHLYFGLPFVSDWDVLVWFQEEYINMEGLCLLSLFLGMDVWVYC